MNDKRKYLTLSLFGHSQLVESEKIRENLYNYIKSKYCDKKIRILVGTHGKFDGLGLGVSMKLLYEKYDVEINLVFTSQKLMEKEFKDDLGYYRGVIPMMYFIEEEHFKRQIIVSNQKMIDESDEVIVYFNPNYHLTNGVRRIVKYAIKQNKRIFNLFDMNYLKF